MGLPPSPPSPSNVSTGTCTREVALSSFLSCHSSCSCSFLHCSTGSAPAAAHARASSFLSAAEVGEEIRGSPSVSSSLLSPFCCRHPVSFSSCSCSALLLISPRSIPMLFNSTRAPSLPLFRVIFLSSSSAGLDKTGRIEEDVNPSSRRDFFGTEDVEVSSLTATQWMKLRDSDKYLNLLESFFYTTHSISVVWCHGLKVIGSEVKFPSLLGLANPIF